MRRVALGCALAAVPWQGLTAQAVRGDTFELARRAFFDNRFGEALPLFVAATRSSPRDADRYAWAAEAARRADDYETAHTMARRALALKRCSSFAHDVLGALYNPSFSDWARTDQDSAAAHWRAAVACDSTDGNAWLSVVFDAMRAGDTTLERRALRKLIETGFLTPPQMAYARWILETLPERAVLLAFGDMDTYPLLALQVAHGLRTDVAVVNVHQLNLPWYPAALLRRHGLSGLRRPDGADSMKTLAHVFAAALQEASLDSRLGRPLATQLGVDTTLIVDRAQLQLAGPYWLVVAKGAPFLDTLRMDAGFRRAEALDWTGEAVAANDRSPIRRRYTWHPALIAAYPSTIGAYVALDQGDEVLARWYLYWAERFLARAKLEPDQVTQLLGDLRESLTPD